MQEGGILGNTINLCQTTDAQHLNVELKQVTNTIDMLPLLNVLFTSFIALVSVLSVQYNVYFVYISVLHSTLKCVFCQVVIVNKCFLHLPA